MGRYYYVNLLLVLLPALALAQPDTEYQNYVREVEARWNEYLEQQEFQEFQRQQDAAFQEFQRQQAEAYRQYVEEIERKWNEFIGSSRTEWVEYSDDKDVRSIVNFESPDSESDEPQPVVTPEPSPETAGPIAPLAAEAPPEVPSEPGAQIDQPASTGIAPGQIKVEALVPAEIPDAVDKAKAMISRQIENLFSAANAAKQSILEKQVQTKTGEPVQPQNVQQFVEEEVLPSVQVAPQPVQSKDGVERVKVSVVIPMVPDHLRIRAERYLETVRKHGARYEIDVPLALAVIQTESYFNPLAKSPVPAFGLMQLVPNSGGYDAYRHVFKKDQRPAPDFLYVPENNVLLGVGYLNLLKEKYLYGIKDPLKQEYLAIAAYNGGIGRVIRRVLKKYNVAKMSPDEVFDVLRREMPDETKDYLAKVVKLKAHYTAWQ